MVALALEVQRQLGGGQCDVRDRFRLQRASRLLLRRARQGLLQSRGPRREDLVRGPGSTDAVKQVASGAAQIGFADSSAVVFAKANETTFRSNWSQSSTPSRRTRSTCSRIPALPDRRIWKAQKLADTAFSAVPKMFGAYAKAAGIDASKVTWVVAGSDALPGMLSLGRVDGIGQFTVGEPLLKKSGRAERRCSARLFRRRARLLRLGHGSDPRKAHCSRTPTWFGASSPRRCTG